MQTLDCISPRGMAVSFGSASGSPPLLDLSILAGKGSLKVTRPTVSTYVLNRSLLEPMAVDLFDKVSSGKVKIEIKQCYALKDAVQAHRDLEGRKTTGSTILLP
jgi:NADPH2:quinone reductase